MTRERSEASYTEVEGVTVMRETPKALLLMLEDGREAWVPKSLISDESEVSAEGDEGTCLIATWFCEKEGLE